MKAKQFKDYMQLKDSTNVHMKRFIH